MTSKKHTSVVSELEVIRNTAFCSYKIHRLYNHNGKYPYKLGCLPNTLSPAELDELVNCILQIDPDFPDSSDGVIEERYILLADCIKRLEVKYSLN